jgi:ABC-type oligopeptide transport system ATPase subunit
MSDSPPLLEVRRICRDFQLRRRGLLRRPVQTLRAVDDVSFTLHQGETLGIVGESGSGKTTLVRCILRALQPTSGEALLHTDGVVHDLAKLSHRQLKPLRRQMQMIFQDPFSSLNPRMTVAQIVSEPLVIHRMGNRSQRLDRVVEMLQRVGLSAEHLHRYPHAFSGGQRQRIGIARALILRPRLMIADEAVSALDVSVQAQVLDLLMALQREFGLTTIFVSHDLGVVRRICSRVAVMYRGRIMEIAPTETLFQSPGHAYTKVLLSAIPYPDPDRPLNPLHVSDLSADELAPLPQ